MRQMMTGDDIRKAREFLGESQKIFAKRFKVNQSTVHRWESGESPVEGPARIVVENLLATVAKRQQEAAE